MKREEIETKVLRHISEIMGVPLNELSVESSSDNVDDWDSMTQMSLILALQDEFKVNLSKVETKTFAKVKTILDTLEAMLP